MNMPILLAIGWEHYAFTIPISLLSIFLGMVILVQRGRGGGLTGALGGMGGQSAFGTKAGDLFTRITVGVAAVWILLSMAALKMLNKTGLAKVTPPAATAPAQGGTTTDTPAKGDSKKGDAKTGDTKATGTKTGDTSTKAGSGATTTTPKATTTPPATTPAAETTTTPATTPATPPVESTPAPAPATPDAPATPEPSATKSGDEPAATIAPE